MNDEPKAEPTDEAKIKALMVVMREQVGRPALASYLANGGDAAATVRALIGEQGWPHDFAEQVVAAVRAAAPEGLQGQAHGVSVTPPELAALAAQQIRRAAEIHARSTTFFSDLAELVPAGKTVEAAVTPEQVDHLARKHGLTIGPDGRPTLASVAAEG
jgi:hypothetical protein